jgi:MFS family permease
MRHGPSANPGEQQDDARLMTDVSHPIPVSPSASSTSPTRRLLPLVLVVFFGFLSIGLPLPALPLYVHGELGYSALVVGWAVGIQSLGTVLSRKFSGSYCDRRGPRRAVMLGLPLAAASGLLYVVSTFISHPASSIAVLLAGRVLMGPAESLFLTGAMAWGISRVGPSNTGQVMSLQGLAMFSAMAAGAPLGILAMNTISFTGVGVCALVLPLVALVIALRTPAPQASPHGRKQAPFLQTVGLIWRQGLTLALASTSFALITAFIVLYFGNNHWEGAGLALSAFAIGYIVVRVLFGKFPDRFGGRRCAAVSIAVSAAGLAMLWQAGSAGFALAGSTLAGVGFSLVFPAMGVEAMRRVPAESRGTAIASFAAFVDVTSGATGPLAGLLIGVWGYGSAFLAGMCACLLALAVVAFGMTDAPRRG